MPREIRRSRRAATPEEIARHKQQWAEADAELPEFLARNQRRAKALQEPGFSGQLRRAVAASPLHPEHLAAAAGIPLQDLADFMCDDRPLDTAAVDRLAEQLRFTLVPTF